MARDPLKKATLTSRSDTSDVHATVKEILSDIEAGGDAKTLEYTARFDKDHDNTLLTPDEITAAGGLVPDKLKDDIRFAHDNVRRFAEAQKDMVANVEVELDPGFITGQKALPVDAPG